LQADDDPREFLSGDNHQHNHESDADHTSTRTFRRQIFLPDGGSAQLFSISHGNRGEAGDDIYQFFTPRNEASNEQQEQPEPSINNIVQALLANLMNQAHTESNNTNNNNNNNESSQESTTDNPQTATGNNESGSGSGNRPFVFYGNMVNGSIRFQPFSPINSNNQEQQQQSQQGDEQNNNNNDTRGNVASSILQFITAMTGGALGEEIVGNPNDYVFSRTAFDNIITQLMEQAGGGSAPPPAPEQVIETLPKRGLTEKEKSQEADCAVCKDAFEATEQVIQLPCEHIFHDDCIKPWLKLNSTCPVCRHSVLPDQQEHSQQSDLNNREQGQQGNNEEHLREQQHSSQHPDDIDLD
ncbi:hypothetical protein CU097_003914, partial [Rhizopus azygosporus]